MKLTEWHQKAQLFNRTGPHHCPRRPPCLPLSQGVAIYEYVTGKEGRAIVVRCTNCGALKHVEMSLGDEREVFTPVWVPGDSLPLPTRVVHLPEGPRYRLRSQPHIKGGKRIHE